MKFWPILFLIFALLVINNVMVIDGQTTTTAAASETTKSDETTQLQTAVTTASTASKGPEATSKPGEKPNGAGFSMNTNARQSFVFIIMGMILFVF